MHFIELNLENLILNQIHDIMVHLQTQKKHIKLCKIPTHMGIDDNEAADETSKEAVKMPELTTLRLPYTD